MHRLPTFVLALLASGFLLACAGSNAETYQAEEQLGPVKRLARSFEAYNPEEGLRIRHNPPSCACTPWEALIADKWVRVVLQPTEDEEMAQALKDHTEGGKSARVFGELLSSPFLCTPSTLCAVMKFSSWKP